MTEGGEERVRTRNSKCLLIFRQTYGGKLDGGLVGVKDDKISNQIVQIYNTPEKIFFF